jgi:Na+-transporting NADH:ubiquinone oxidoreductase subunit NqrC
MKKSSRSWLTIHRVEVAVAIVFCLIGFVLGVGARYDLQLQTRFDDKINAVDLLTLICTVIIAWVVTSILDRQKQAEKTAKDTLLKRAEELHNFILETAIKSTSANFLYTDAASAAKRVVVTTDRICKLLESNQISCDTQIKTDINNHVDKLLDLMTNTPVQDSTDTSQQAVEVKDGKLSFSSERALEIENTFEDLKHSVMVLELAIINS